MHKGRISMRRDTGSLLYNSQLQKLGSLLWELVSAIKFSIQDKRCQYWQVVCSGQRASERGDLGPVPVRGRSLNAPRTRPTRKPPRRRRRRRHRPPPLQLVCDPITRNLNLDAGILIVESNVSHNPDSRCPIGSISKIRHCLYHRLLINYAHVK